ncbi:MAG TPA: hypothetical protein VE820_05360 [Sphingomicrobium sp.]|jgi:hypothetical protein|nr:hypothetical protein [Sphingomicrobium sp.]
MARKLLLLVLTLAGCAKGADADLPYIGQARSLAAEWALLNEQASDGHLTGAYTRTMRAAVRQQLETTSKSIGDPRSRYGVEIAALLKEPDDAPPAALRAHAAKLKQIEDSLESA